MYYNFLNSEKVSALGMGAMRLPCSNGHIDIKKTKQLIDLAIENGINYFDTGYKYHNGESETVLGKILNQYNRKLWKLATKMPGHMMQKKNNKLCFRGYMRHDTPLTVAEIFEEQLKKCDVEYFDFYLLHNLNDISYDIYTDDEIGIVEYLLQQKKDGRIKHFGFSTHGSIKVIQSFICKYKCFDFAQIQLNYFDWFCGDAKRQYELFTKHKIPLIIMEPCRGGRLATLSDKPKYMLKSLNSNVSIASWAFRFLQTLPNVCVTLSGMNSTEQLIDNIKTYETNGVLGQHELKKLKEISNLLKNLVLCTGCSYCCESCPKEIDIPTVLECYNNYISNHKYYFDKTVRDEIDKCVSCRLCREACPQKLEPYNIFEKIRDLD